MLISLYMPVPWACMILVSALKHTLGGNKKVSNAETKPSQNPLLKTFSNALLSISNNQGQCKTIGYTHNIKKIRKVRKKKKREKEAKSVEK